MLDDLFQNVGRMLAQMLEPCNFGVSEEADA